MASRRRWRCPSSTTPRRWVRVFQFKRRLVVNYERLDHRRRHTCRTRWRARRAGALRDNLVITARETAEALAINVDMRLEARQRRAATGGDVQRRAGPDGPRRKNRVMQMDCRLLLQERPMASGVLTPGSTPPADQESSISTAMETAIQRGA